MRDDVTEPKKTQTGCFNASRNNPASMLLVVLALLFSLVCDADGKEGRIVRVGIFQNEPIVFQDESGLAKGFYVDLLDAIAEQEDWDIRYVPDTWDGCLERLGTGDIDLMTSIAYSEERDAFADFSREIVWTLWGMVFVHPESGIEDISYLEGRKVAVLENGINGINFQKLCSEFGVTCDILDMPSYDAAMKAVETGQANAAVVNSVFGTICAGQYRVKQSSIVFSPINAFFAVPENTNGDLVVLVDSYLQNWKRDKGSVYYQSLNRWLQMQEKSVVSKSVKWSLLATAILAIGGFTISYILKKEVATRTVQLKKELEERKKAEDALRESLDHLRLALEAACMGTFEWIITENRSIWSPELLSIFGTTIEEFDGCYDTYLDFVPPENRQKVDETVKRFMINASDLDVIIYDHEIIRGDGKFAWVEVRARLYVDDQGQPYRFSGIGVDITERKQAEEEVEKHRDHLKELVDERTRDLQKLNEELWADITDRKKAEKALATERDRANNILEGTNAGTWNWNIQTGELLLNERWAEITGHSLEELEPVTVETWAKNVHPDDLPIAKEMLEKHFKGELDYYDVVFRQPHKDGGWVWVNARGRVIEWTDDGKPLRMSGTHLDVTDRKRAEQDREILLDNLSEKTNEMENLLRIVTHDLRVPLLNIQGFGDMLETNCRQMTQAIGKVALEDQVKDEISVLVDNEIPEALNFISTSVKKMDVLIEGLSQLSKAGTVELHIETLDMNELVRQVTDTVRFRADELGASINIESLPDCKADANQINQVFSNLINNSLKYFDPERKCQITISAQVTDDMSTYCIEDNGIGIPEGHVNKVFDLFHQVGQKSESGGEGVGLATVKQILNRNHGQIRLESEVGKGSKFFVLLPMPQEADKDGNLVASETETTL